MANSVYLAGSVHSDWHGLVKKSCPGLIFYSPAEHGLKSPAEYTAWDLAMIRKSDIVFGYMESSNPSGFGLATEVGYAKALNRLIILVDEKSNYDYEFKQRFMFVRYAADVTFDNLSDGIRVLMTFGRVGHGY